MHGPQNVKGVYEMKVQILSYDFGYPGTNILNLIYTCIRLTA